MSLPRHCGAYRLEGRVTILPTVTSQEQLLVTMPYGAEPGVWLWGKGEFVSLADVDPVVAMVRAQQAERDFRDWQEKERARRAGFITNLHVPEVGP